MILRPGQVNGVLSGAAIDGLRGFVDENDSVVACPGVDGLRIQGGDNVVIAAQFEAVIAATAVNLIEPGFHGADEGRGIVAVSADDDIRRGVAQGQRADPGDAAQNAVNGNGGLGGGGDAAGVRDGIFNDVFPGVQVGQKLQVVDAGGIVGIAAVGVYGERCS